MTPENYHLLQSGRAFAQMKDGVMIVNTSRGGLDRSQRRHRSAETAENRRFGHGCL